MVYVYSPSRETQNGEMNAQDQIAILRRLSTFVSKEAIPVTIVFPGRPTRKIPDGTSQDGVKARYATSDQLRKVVASAIAEAKRNHSAVLAANSPEIEKLARSERIRHIQAKTFEEALDSICGPIRREQQQPQQRRAQPQQQANASRPQPDQQPGQPAAEPTQDSGEAPQAPRPEPPPPRQEPQRPRRSEPPQKKEERDQAIMDLIDPL